MLYQTEGGRRAKGSGPLVLIRLEEAPSAGGCRTPLPIASYTELEPLERERLQCKIGNRFVLYNLRKMQFRGAEPAHSG